MADIQPINDVDAAKKWLVENKDKVAGFDEKYGQGAAIAVLKGTYVKPDIPEKSDSPSILSEVTNQALDVIQGIGRGFIGAPTEILDTVANANAMGTEDAQALYDKTINYRNDVLAKRGLPAMTPQEEEDFSQRMGVGLASGGVAVRDERKDFTTQNAIDGLGLTDALEVDTMAGSLAEGFSQFISGYVMLGGGGGIVRSLATGAVVDATAFDPYDKNISAIVQEHGWMQNYITEALATDADAPEWENRLKNSVEGGILGLALEGTVATIKHYVKVNKARKELAEDGKVSDSTIQEIKDAEAEIQKFADLEGKPKGKVVEGKFITDDGMIFDMNTGARDFEAEKLTLSSKVDAQAQTAAPDALKAPEQAGDAPKIQDPQGTAKAPEIEVKAPAQPKAPKLVNSDALLKAAKNAATRADPKTFDLQGNQVGFFNWDKMDGPQDAKKLMDAIGETLSASKSMKVLEPQKLEAINKQAMTELKDLTGADLPALTARFGETAKTTQDLAVQLVAGKTALQSTSRRITDLVEQLDSLEKAGKANSDVEEKLIDALELHADMQAAVKSIQTSAARATAAGRIRTADAISDAALNKIERYGGSARLKKLANRIKAAPTDAAKAKLIRKGVERTWLGKSIDVVNEVWLNAILSGPHTHALNLGANSINMMVRPAIRMVGGAATLNGHQIEEGFRQYLYMTGEMGSIIKTIATVGMHGGDSALKNFFRAWWREEGILDVANKFDGANPNANKAIASANLGGGAVVDFAGKSMRLAGRTLQAEDELFKQITFNSRLQAIITSQARRLTDDQIKAAGYESRADYISGEISKAKESQESLAEKWQMMVLTGKVADDATAKAEFIQKNVGAYNHNSDAAKMALAEARETTFTTPLQNGTFSKYIQDMMQKFPVLRQVMPFIQTPTNILRTSFERTPLLNFAMQRQREIFMRGTPEERAMVVGNQIVGGFTTMLAINYAMQGRITGGGPSYKDDTDKAKLWNNSPDWQPYSVNIGTVEEPKWIELKKLDPHGFLFGIVGDVYEMQQYIGNHDDWELSQLTAMIAASFSNNVMSKTYMMSLSDTLNIFDGSANATQIDQFLQNRAASIVPYSQLSYQLNQDMDESMRELRSFTDKVKARVYGMNNAAVKHDWLTGEAVDTPEYMLGFVRQKIVDSGEHKAAKVYTELRKLDHAFVGPQKTIGDLELGPEVFQRYNELVGTLRINNRTLLEELDRQIDSATYKKFENQVDIEKPRSEDDPRVKLINQFMQIYKKRAQSQLYKEFPELGETVLKNKVVKKALQLGGDPAEFNKELVFKFPPDN